MNKPFRVIDPVATGANIVRLRKERGLTVRDLQAYFGFEEPQAIINDMLAGLNARQMKKVLSIVDRKEAIRTACMLAEKGDVILIAGKGHEDYQEIKGVKHHFDDREEVRNIFAQ
mgnify:CR=1 FL=1